MSSFSGAEDVGVTETAEEPSELNGDERCYFVDNVNDVARDERQGRSPQVENSTLRDDPEPLAYDVPWIHADAPAFMVEDGSVILPQCPYCGGTHRHHSFGHRIAHCVERKGRGMCCGRAGLRHREFRCNLRRNLPAEAGRWGREGRQ